MALRDQSTQTIERPDWLLLDDTEESVVGADWHQEAIRNLVSALLAVARTQALPWHIGDQLTLVGWRPDGRDWRPCPDVSVHATAGPERRQELRLRGEGVPALLIEVLSASTQSNDLSLTERPLRKPHGYLRVWRVPEYLVFDPRGEWVAGQCRGWRRVGETLEEWQPDRTGRYVSALGVGFAPEDVLLRVYGLDGVPLPFEYEQAELLAAARARAETERRRADTLEAELRRLRGEIR